GKGVATLGQLRADSKLMQQISADSKEPYDVTPERLTAVQIYPAFALSGVAPRMRFLESLWPGDAPRLATDAAKLNSATPEIPPGKWAGNVLGTPLRLIAEFVPINDGGTDKGSDDRSRRMKYFIESQPQARVPAFIAQLPGTPGEMLRANARAMLWLTRR